MRTLQVHRVGAAVWLATTLIASIGPYLHARTQQPSSGAPVAIDFRAVGDDGGPILDLKAEEIALRVNGKPREVRSLRLVHAGAGDASALAAPFATNVVSEAGRDVLLVVDNDSITPGREQPMRDAIGHLLAALSPRDRVGLLSVRPGGALLNPSTDRSALRNAVLTLRGEAPRNQTSADLVCRTKTTLQALTTILGNITTGSPTTIVFFSSSLASPTPERNARIGGDSGICQLRTEDFQQISVNVIRSQAHFYVAHLIDGMAVDPGNPLGAGLENLTGATGGEMIRLSGTNADALVRIARETSAYYVVVFQPDAAERTGESQKIDLRVSREHVKVRIRPAVTIPTLTARASRPPAPKEMIRVPDVFRDLPLRSTAYSTRNAGDDKIKVVALFEPAEPGVALSSAVVGLFDERGRLAAQWTAEAADLARLPVVAAIPVQPGTYRLRVASVDATGRTGTTDENLRADFTRTEPVRVSGLVLGVPASGSFAPKLLFTDDPAAVGYLEIYNAPKSAAVTASFELAPSEAAAPMASVPATVSASQTDLLRAAYGGFNISGLAPGDYILRAIVSVDGKEVARLGRTLRKSK